MITYYTVCLWALGAWYVGRLVWFIARVATSRRTLAWEPTDPRWGIAYALQLGALGAAAIDLALRRSVSPSAVLLAAVGLGLLAAREIRTATQARRGPKAPPGQ